MVALEITGNEAGQRLDKLLAKYLDAAPRGFLYKMLRKKNITLNGHGAKGGEILAEGDEVRLYFSDETIAKFHTGAALHRAGGALDILYEDGDILLINKPAGMLSQKAAPQDVSLVEYVTTYLLDAGELTPGQLATFRPAVCNRLDRNTSGIVVAGKSLAGLQQMSLLLKDRTLHKYYRCIVVGTVEGHRHMQAYLSKNPRTNQVTVSDTPFEGSVPIETEYTSVCRVGELTMLEVRLITGKSHQIRAHLAWMGHPILGDPKYGDPSANRRYRRSHGVSCQLLHAYRLEFPPLEGRFAHLSGRSFTAPLPTVYRQLLQAEGWEEPGGIGRTEDGREERQ